METYNIPCPLTEDQIEELGLKKGSPTPPKPLKEREKKFIHDAQTGEFKPSWCPSHSNDTNSPEVRGTADWREKTSQSMGTEKRGDNFYASRSVCYAKVIGNNICIFSFEELSRKKQ